MALRTTSYDQLASDGQERDRHPTGSNSCTIAEGPPKKLTSVAEKKLALDRTLRPAGTPLLDRYQDL